MKAEMVHVRCVDCGALSQRKRRIEERGTFGGCTHCGGEMRPQTRRADARAAQAKADLARYERRTA